MSFDTTIIYRREIDSNIKHPTRHVVLETNHETDTHEIENAKPFYYTEKYKEVQDVIRMMAPRLAQGKCRNTLRTMCGMAGPSINCVISKLLENAATAGMK